VIIRYIDSLATFQSTKYLKRAKFFRLKRLFDWKSAGNLWIHRFQRENLSEGGTPLPMEKKGQESVYVCKIMQRFLSDEASEGGRTEDIEIDCLKSCVGTKTVLKDYPAGAQGTSSPVMSPT
jgi:hypothetical protein